MPPAGGQSQRFAGVDREVGLHEQLYRYAEDLQHLLERHGSLTSRYEEMRESCERLDESRAELEELIRCSSDIHIVTDIAGLILQSNPAAAVIAAPTHLAGYNLADWVQPAKRDVFHALCQSALEAGINDQRQQELHFRSDRNNGRAVICSAQVLVIRKRDEQTALHWILRDVTRQREREVENQISSMVFNNAIEGVMICAVDGDILAVNPAFTQITGYSAEEVIGRNPRFLKSGVQDANFYVEFWRDLRAKGTWQGEIYNRRKTGEVYPEWLTISAARDADDNVLSYIGVFSDLTRLLQTEKRLSYLAHHDTLTGLPNRLLFQDRLSQTISQARRTGVPFTVIFIDLDNFKRINDTLGHEVGDKVLQEAASRLVSAVREVDTVARLGGDEFVILAPTLTGSEDIGQVCNKALDALAPPILIDEHALTIGGSFGCAEYPLHGDDETTLVKHADVAMYRAKAMGGNVHVIYREQAAAPAENEDLRLETQLRQAIAREQLFLEYQPQVASGSGRLLGVEALLRWNHPQLGVIPPNRIIPLAEQIGLIVPIGQWVIQNACQQLAAWDRQELPPISMGVNVSARQLRDPGFVDMVKQTLADSSIAPERLELEITEAELMLNREIDRLKLEPLRKMGVKIAIDDFGNIYASLALLLRTPVDRIKIDGGFVSGLGQGDEAHKLKLHAALVALGQAMGVDLIAEGVENNQQQTQVADQGCGAIQGYLTGRPMSATDLVKWMGERQ